MENRLRQLELFTESLVNSNASDELIAETLMTVLEDFSEEEVIAMDEMLLLNSIAEEVELLEWDGGSAFDTMRKLQINKPLTNKVPDKKVRAKKKEEDPISIITKGMPNFNNKKPATPKSNAIVGYGSMSGKPNTNTITAHVTNSAPTSNNSKRETPSNSNKPETPASNNKPETPANNSVSAYTRFASHLTDKVIRDAGKAEKRVQARLDARENALKKFLPTKFSAAPGNDNKPETPASNNKPETPASNKPETPTNNKPETPTNNKPETPASNKPETPASNKPETPASNKPETPASNNKPETPASNNKPETPTNNKPETPTNGKRGRPRKNEEEKQNTPKNVEEKSEETKGAGEENNKPKTPANNNKPEAPEQKTLEERRREKIANLQKSLNEIADKIKRANEKGEDTSSLLDSQERLTKELEKEKKAAVHEAKADFIMSLLNSNISESSLVEILEMISNKNVANKAVERDYKNFSDKADELAKIEERKAKGLPVSKEHEDRVRQEVEKAGTRYETFKRLADNKFNK